MANTTLTLDQVYTGPSKRDRRSRRAEPFVKGDFNNMREDQLVVSIYDPRVHRVCSFGFDRRDYLKAYREGRLEYQHRGTERPAHYPDPENLAEAPRRFH